MGYLAEIEVQLEWKACILLEQDQLASSLNNANQRMHEAEQEFHNVNVERTALAATFEPQTEEISSLEAENKSLHKLLVHQEVSSITDRMRRSRKSSQDPWNPQSAKPTEGVNG